ncbi:MAG: V-type ATPase subunit [Nocardioidaceae bacterium]
MSGRWVAGVVRARALQRRRLGRAGVRDLADSASLAEAVATLARTPYGHDVRPGADLAAAQRAVADSALWNLRVLAGWLPAPGAELLRVLAGWFEVANVDELLRALHDLPAEPPYRLGTLATAWPQLAGATSVPDLRERLGRTTWGAAAGADPWQVQLGMRLAWADRVAARVPAARDLAVAGAGLLLARETVGRGRSLPEGAVLPARRLLGDGAVRAASLGALAAALPARSRELLDGVEDPAAVWRAEARWWRRLEQQAFALGRSGGFDADQVLSAAGLLAVDAWRVRAALALAGRPGSAEVLDAVA